MADYIVKDTELTSVANAIRTAGVTNSLLSFPNGFISAVENISGGGDSWQTVFEDDVETHYDSKSGRNIGEMSFDTDSLSETIKVTFNRAEYICNQNDNGSYGAVYGFSIDFSEYPFSIMDGYLYVQGEDTTVNTVKIEVPQSGGSSDFSTVEVTVEGMNPFQHVLYGPHISDEGDEPYLETRIPGDGVYQILLYGAGTYMYTNSEDVQATGDIDCDGGDIWVTGSGTISSFGK